MQRRNFREQLVDHRLVHGRLLGCEQSPFADLPLFWQFGLNFRVGFSPPQKHRSQEHLQLGRCIATGVSQGAFNEGLAEPRRRPEIARVQEVHQRPQFLQPILNRRSRQCNSMIRLNHPDGLRLLRVDVLDILRLVDD